MRLLFLLLLLASPLSLSSISHSAELSGPLDIEADTLDVLPNKGKATFSGNVKLKQDGMTLNANNLTLNSVPGDTSTIKEAVARGNVKLTFKGGTATGTKAVWRTSKNDVVLSGAVKLTQGGNTLTGETLTYNLTTQQARLSSGNSGRVKAIFTPTK